WQPRSRCGRGGSAGRGEAHPGRFVACDLHYAIESEMPIEVLPRVYFVMVHVPIADAIGADDVVSVSGPPQADGVVAFEHGVKRFGLPDPRAEGMVGHGDGHRIVG